MARLDLADLLGTTRAPVQQIEQLRVDAVDFVANDGKFL